MNTLLDDNRVNGKTYYCCLYYCVHAIRVRFAALGDMTSAPRSNKALERVNPIKHNWALILDCHVNIKLKCMHTSATW